MGGAKKVLVIEDDHDIREIIKMILDEEGYEVSELDNGHFVDNAISMSIPDVILLDVMLGDMDGRDICNRLKSQLETAGIPIIIVSATHGRYSTGEKRCNADDYLDKPFDMMHLIKKSQTLFRSITLLASNTLQYPSTFSIHLNGTAF